ncbi:hypothetical protein HY448_00900 [Candidatus Pacearchaeota archaeon]|nr:hypothetical protein [Candidatus Pacearchaeota archaeon]
MVQLIEVKTSDGFSLEGMPESLSYHSTRIKEDGVKLEIPEEAEVYFVDPRDESRRTLHYFTKR